MQVAPSCGQFFNSCKWRHLVAKFGTNASGATISWRDNSSLDAIPWVRCASGNVYLIFLYFCFFFFSISRWSLWLRGATWSPLSELRPEHHSAAINIILIVMHIQQEIHFKEWEKYTLNIRKIHLKVSELRPEPLPALVGNNWAHIGGVGCELVITYQETGLLLLPVPVQEGSPQMRRRSKQFDPFPPGWGPGGGASNFGPLPSLVGTGTEKINLRLWGGVKKKTQFFW